MLDRYGKRGEVKNLLRIRWPQIKPRWGKNASLSLAVVFLFLAVTVPVLRTIDMPADWTVEGWFDQSGSMSAEPASSSAMGDADARVAEARLTAGPLAPEIRGTVRFHSMRSGTQVIVTVRGLPKYEAGSPPIGPFGFHIHDVGQCEVGDPKDPFASAGGHYNPDQQTHGNHAGDLPVLFSNDGIARMLVYTDRYQVQDIIGKSILIHQNPDDFRTDPSGNSGLRLACGIIEEIAQ